MQQVLSCFFLFIIQSLTLEQKKMGQITPTYMLLIKNYESLIILRLCNSFKVIPITEDSSAELKHNCLQYYYYEVCVLHLVFYCIAIT